MIKISEKLVKLINEDRRAEIGVDASICDNIKQCITFMFRLLLQIEKFHVMISTSFSIHIKKGISLHFDIELFIKNRWIKMNAFVFPLNDFFSFFQASPAFPNGYGHYSKSI